MNILVITPYFPSLDVIRDRSEDPRTKFLYDYAVEWAKLGHHVLVLHTPPKYPLFFQWVAYFLDSVPFGRRFQLKRFVQNTATLKNADYVHNGLHIIRVPVPKYVPHRDYLEINLVKLRKKVNLVISNHGWTTDLIISDFLSPSLDVACHINEFSKVLHYQIFHQSDLKYFNAHKYKMLKLLGKVSGALFRSNSNKNLFENAGYSMMNFDYIFSGIPSNTILGHPRSRVVKFLYVGSLRYSKNVHKVLQAFAEYSVGARCSLEIVGSGPDELELKQLACKLSIDTQVTFTGRVSRENVFEKMRQSDCLVMVSKETFGMVYIEAMSQGCIVVAAKGQGIDGIVVDGENGFLVPLEDTNALAKILHRISLLSANEVSRVSQNAIATAAQMTDDVLARDLLKRLHACHRGNR